VCQQAHGRNAFKTSSHEESEEGEGETFGHTRHEGTTKREGRRGVREKEGEGEGEVICGNGKAWWSVEMYDAGEAGRRLNFV
jgi:hypothetical protein